MSPDHFSFAFEHLECYSVNVFGNRVSYGTEGFKTLALLLPHVATLVEFNFVVLAYRLLYLLEF